jgi:hypothetical protein
VLKWGKRRLEVTCRGPAEVALQRASEWGVKVKGYTHSYGGLVTLFADEEDVDLVERWYECYMDLPGDVVGYVLR